LEDKSLPVKEAFCPYKARSMSEPTIQILKKEDEEETALVGPDAKFDDFRQFGYQMNGVIDKKGKLHLCRYEYHETLCRHGLGFVYGSSDLEKNDCVKLQEGRFFRMENYSGQNINFCNQRQYDTMFDWCITHGADFGQYKDWDIR
jgi:hypothetical protein